MNLGSGLKLVMWNLATELQVLFCIVDMELLALKALVPELLPQGGSAAHFSVLGPMGTKPGAAGAGDVPQGGVGTFFHV